MPDQGFPRHLRLRRSVDFRSIQRRGSKVGGRDVILLWRPATEDFTRFGLTVSRRVGNSVVRNRVKRWLREGLRRHRGEVEVPVDVVVIARPSSALAGADSLEAQLVKGLRRIRARVEA